MIKRDFDFLAQVTLPLRYSELMVRLRNPLPMATFYEKGVGESEIFKAIKNHFNLKNKLDFSGCYVFSEGEINQYVGITRNISTRIRQHLKGVTHYHSSLAYLIAKNNSVLGLRRKENMQNEIFLTEFKKAQKRISTWGLSVIEINDPVELYLFEIYTSLKLETIYNSFETH